MALWISWFYWEQLKWIKSVTIFFPTVNFTLKNQLQHYVILCELYGFPFTIRNACVIQDFSFFHFSKQVINSMHNNSQHNLFINVFLIEKAFSLFITAFNASNYANYYDLSETYSLFLKHYFFTWCRLIGPLCVWQMWINEWR